MLALVARLLARPQGDRPVTLGIGEPFTTTVTVSLVFALIVSLPFLLMQAYAFLVPALEPEQQPRVKRVTQAVPGLFVAGAAFCYFVVLPAAVHFFQNFNSDQFNVLVQASQYYKFAATTILAMGLLFQVPVAILAITRAWRAAGRYRRPAGTQTGTATRGRGLGAVTGPAGLLSPGAPPRDLALGLSGLERQRPPLKRGMEGRWGCIS